MPDLNCPHCHFLLRVPDSLMGKRLRCKNESCKRTFVAELEPAGFSSGAEAPPPFSDMPADWQQAAEERGREEVNEAKSSRPARPAEPDYFADDGDQRYPNLLKYLAWARSIILTLAILAYIAIVIGAFGNLMMLSRLTGSELEFVGALFVGLLMTAISAAFVHFIYVCLMAGIELIQVVIDIEENTRKQPALEERS